MTKQKITIEQIRETFNDITPIQGKHGYQTTDNKRYIGVTTILNKFSAQFDRLAVAKSTSEKRGIPVDILLKEWDASAEYSRTMGLEFHKYIEDLVNGVPHTLTHISETNEESNNLFEDEEDNTNKKNTANVLLEDFNKRIAKYEPAIKKLFDKYVPIATELLVYDKESRLCGVIDMLAYNEEKGKFFIFDWKTNKEMKQNSFGRKMKKPFEEIPDSDVCKYSLQLSSYKAMLEKAIPEIEIGGIFICHVPPVDSEYTLKTYPAKDVSKFIKEKLLVSGCKYLAWDYDPDNDMEEIDLFA